MPSSSLKGKSALVTGSGGGLGKAIALAYLTAGANVIVCDVNQERLDATEAEWKTAYPGHVLAMNANVVDEVSVKDLIASSVAKFGKLDILVNNAGIMDGFEPIGTCEKSTWDRVLGVNLTGPFLTTKAAVNQFMSQGEGGLIINIGSNASWRGFSAGVAYTASKHGLMALTKNTAGFYGDKGIYSVALLMGGMDGTNMADSFRQGFDQEAMVKVLSTQPEYKQGVTGSDPANVAKYCVFLSDKGIASSANGSCIVFNKNWPPA